MSTPITTNNSVQATLAQNTPQFLTQNISDPVVQQNFEVLNKYFAAKNSGTKIESANIVFGPAYGATSPTAVLDTTSVQTPGALQLQIATRGNPVRIKLAPFFYGNSFYSQLLLVQGITAPKTTLPYASANFGWTRTDVSTNIQTAIMRQTVSIQVPSTSPAVVVGTGDILLTSGSAVAGTGSLELVGASTASVAMNIPLPAFEMDDVVPQGTYTYQFNFQLATLQTQLTAYNIQAVAYELR